MQEMPQDSKGRIPEDKLLAYLEGRLSPEEQRQVELWLSEEGMEADAVEGLQQIPAGEVRQSVEKLNYQLRKKLKAKDRRRAKPIMGNRWAIIAIILILLLAVVGYLILKMMVR